MALALIHDNDRLGLPRLSGAIGRSLTFSAEWRGWVMRDEYIVGNIQADQAAQALVLLQVAVPALQAKTWQSLVHGENRWDIVCVTDLAGYVRGLSLSAIRMHPVAGKLLDVPILVVGSAVNDSEIAEHLFNNAKSRAITAGCQVMRFWGGVPDAFERLNDPVFYNQWDHGLMYRLNCATPALQ